MKKLKQFQLMLGRVWHWNRYQTPATALSHTLIFILASTQTARSSPTGMPWETPLATVVYSFQGPVAYVVSILALVLLFIRYSYGGELNGFGRALITIIIGIAGLVGATGLLGTLFGKTSGAEFVLTF